ncbi:hypothetical protein KIN20_034374 [Parelaphostrongylus tenuis]|uniref:Uncharacterized protein n=1 Tax=Parelaphostrongylus tenuis TaxID=148309 RepID=A0AAD5R9I5_PARTN|nr:hypothetical protein KIN20_034374 [Parelaphostrongylus tenuis]
MSTLTRENIDSTYYFMENIAHTVFDVAQCCHNNFMLTKDPDYSFTQTQMDEFAELLIAKSELYPLLMLYHLKVCSYFLTGNQTVPETDAS